MYVVTCLSTVNNSSSIWFVLPFVITVTTDCAGHFGCCSAFVIDIIIEKLGNNSHRLVSPLSVVFHSNHHDTGNYLFFIFCIKTQGLYSGEHFFKLTTYVQQCIVGMNVFLTFFLYACFQSVQKQNVLLISIHLVAMLMLFTSGTQVFRSTVHLYSVQSERGHRYTMFITFYTQTFIPQYHMQDLLTHYA